MALKGLIAVNIQFWDLQYDSFCCGSLMPMDRSTALLPSAVQ
jgi:hypothetical protein